MTDPNPFDPWLTLLQAWTSAGVAAPERLNQPIFSGWSLFSLTENNSGSPETEKAIVAKASYGRQLGRVIDAVEELIKERAPGSQQKDAFDDLHALAEEIALTKKEAAEARIKRLIADLTLLKDTAPDAYKDQKAAVLAALKDA